MSPFQLVKAALKLEDLQLHYLQKISLMPSDCLEEHCQVVILFGFAMLSMQRVRWCRSLVAKTVVCFPFAGGVIELGVVDLVPEDLSLIHRVKSLFLDSPQTIVPNKSIRVDATIRNKKDPACSALDTELSPVLGCEQLEMVSPINSSDGIEPNQPAEDPFMIDGINDRTSQVQSWKFMDDLHSLNSSDFISQTLADLGDVPLCQGENGNNNGLKEVGECGRTKLATLDPVNDDLHYRTVLSALLKTSHQLILGLHVRNLNKESSFVSWKTNGLVKSQKLKDETPQKLPKKIFFEVPRMPDKELLQSPHDNDVGDAAWRPEADDTCGNHILLERRRPKKKMNDLRLSNH